MIVVDTNTIAYLLISGEHTSSATAVLEKDHKWVAPLLWRSEFLSVLAVYLRRGFMGFSDALELMEGAESLMRGSEYEVASSEVLRLVLDSGCSAYDCEFVALAQILGIPLVTSDKKILALFPHVAVSPLDFTS